MEITHAFVTGCTGQVGSMVAKQLIEEGVKVSLLCRDVAKARKLKELQGGAEGMVMFVQGDLMDKESLRAGMTGCDVVFHCAGFPEQWSKDASLWDVNVTGTEHMVDLALELKVGRFIFTSTMDTLVIVPGERFDESVVETKVLPTPYQVSKQKSDALVAAAVKERGLPACFIHPSAVYGPGVDRSPTMNKFILEVAQNKMPLLVPGGYCLVYSPEVAAAHVAAARKAPVGERYLVSGSYYSLADIARAIRGELATTKVPKQMPLWFASVLSNVGCVVSSITNSAPLLPKSVLHGLTSQGRPDCSKVTNELGITLTDFAQEGVKHALQSLRDKGVLK